LTSYNNYIAPCFIAQGLNQTDENEGMTKLALSLVILWIIPNAFAQTNEQKENFILLSKEKIQLEIENKKLRELFKASEERIKDLTAEKNALEKDLKMSEKDVSMLDKSNEKLIKENAHLIETLTNIKQQIDSPIWQKKN
jgi:regulator of replication initiation timing